MCYEKATDKGHRLILAGHSLGGCQASANYTAFCARGGEFDSTKMHLFNCGSGGGNIIVGQLMPVDAMAAGLTYMTNGSVRAHHHHVWGDVLSSGSPLVALTTTYKVKREANPHTIKQFIRDGDIHKFNV